MKLSHKEFKQNQEKYAEHVRLGALRWLHSIDLNSFSPTYGVADREYWSWKTKDFPNGTWQGGLLGFLETTPFLSLNSEQIQIIVSACLKGTQFIQRKNGSFEEAYPLESSVCVTSLVVFCLLVSFYKHPQFFKQKDLELLKSIVDPAMLFLLKNPETHGLIANHQVTILLAIELAAFFLKNKKEKTYIKELKQLQHPKEFWFPEYGGADPGYQTLLNHYLICGGSILKDAEVIEMISKSVSFISNFSFPDGTFSGEIGSRGTSIFYPSGSFNLTETFSLEPSTTTSWFLNMHINTLGCINPLNVDAGNFVPVFNAWACAVKGILNTEKLKETQLVKNSSSIFKDAGLIVKRNPKTVIAVSTKYSVIRKTIFKKTQGWQDDSLVGWMKEKQTTQGITPDHLIINEQGIISWQYRSSNYSYKLNNLMTSIFLRFFSFITYYFPFLQRMLKRLLVFFVMKKRENRPTSLKIEIDLTNPNYPLKASGNMDGWMPCKNGFHNHMASANTLDNRSIREHHDVS